MDTPPPTDAFLDSVPVLTAFENVADVAAYRPLPDDWVLATADIVGSTEAIAGGRYKAVNMAGASVISALLNALRRRDLPFVFGGDGALVAFPQSQRDLVARTLAAVQAWVKDELGLDIARGNRAARRHPGAWLRRPRRQFPRLRGGRLRDVRRRRRQLGRGRDEGRPLPHRAGTQRHAAGPHRALLPLEPDPVASRRDRLDHRRAERRPVAAGVPAPGFRSCSRWPPRRIAAAIRCRSPDRATAFRRPGLRSRLRRWRRAATGSWPRLSILAQMAS